MRTVNSEQILSNMRKHCFMRNMFTVRNSCKLCCMREQSSMRTTRKTNRVLEHSVKRNHGIGRKYCSHTPKVWVHDE
jgi:hypothetical protein